MAKTKPTPADPPPADAEVRASAPPEGPPATPGPGEAAASIQQEAADRVAAATAEIERLKAEWEAVRHEAAAAAAEIDRLKAELAATQESLTREMREAGEHKAEVWELKAKLADRPAGALVAAAGAGWFEVRVPGCTLPKRVVQADTPAAAVEAYMALFGVTGLPAGPEVVPVDPPEEAPPAS